MNETRKAFIYRMLSMISEIQDKPNLSTKDVTSMLEIQLKIREREIVEQAGEIAKRRYTDAGLHKHSYSNVEHLFKLILNKF